MTDGVLTSSRGAMSIPSRSLAKIEFCVMRLSTVVSSCNRIPLRLWAMTLFGPTMVPWDPSSIWMP